MRNNTGNVEFSRVPLDAVNKDDEMAAFDLLPPAWREIVRNASFLVSAHNIVLVSTDQELNDSWLLVRMIADLREIGHITHEDAWFPHQAPPILPGSV